MAVLLQQMRGLENERKAKQADFQSAQRQVDELRSEVRKSNDLSSTLKKK